MASGLTGSGTKQGDHVFNDLQTAIERPIDSIRARPTRDWTAAIF